MSRSVIACLLGRPDTPILAFARTFVQADLRSGAFLPSSYGRRGKWISRKHRSQGVSTLPRRLGFIAVTCAAAAFAFAPAANAAVVCGPTSQPFASFGDGASYELLPGGSFEGPLDGWSLSGGAAVASGNEPWQVAGDGGSHSLSLPSGASATSASGCGGLDHPTFRFFARRTSTGLLAGLATLRVDVLYRDGPGAADVAAAGPRDRRSSWAPTPISSRCPACRSSPTATSRCASHRPRAARSRSTTSTSIRSPAAARSSRAGSPARGGFPPRKSARRGEAGREDAQRGREAVGPRDVALGPPPDARVDDRLGGPLGRRDPPSPAAPSAGSPRW